MSHAKDIDPSIPTKYIQRDYFEAKDELPPRYRDLFFVKVNNQPDYRTESARRYYDIPPPYNNICDIWNNDPKNIGLIFEW